MSYDDEPRNEKGQFKVGHTGLGGRPKGSRAKLGEAFIADMYEAWQTAGPDVISKVIDTDPAAFLRSMVAILPKEVDVNINKYDSMTDEQLRSQFVAALREARSLGLDLGAGEPANAASEAQQKPPGPVSPLH